MSPSYDDIINLSYSKSDARPHMSQHDRAAQFAPFAALTGFDGMICEEARLTEQKPELSEEQIRLLNERIRYIMEHIKEKPEARLTVFVPDEYKDGGAYITICGRIRLIDTYARAAVLTDKSIVPLDNTVDIQITEEI